MSWLHQKGKTYYLEDYATDPRTGKKHVVSVQVSGKVTKKDREKLEKKVAIVSASATGNVSDIFDAFLAESAATKKPGTTATYRSFCNTFLKVVGNRQISALSAKIIRQSALNTNKPAKTVNGWFAIWRIIFRWAYDNDFIKRKEIFEKLKPMHEVAPAAVDDVEELYLIQDEVAALLPALQERDRLFVEFMLLTGCRAGEIVALDNVDIGKEYIRIRKTYNNATATIGSPKTAAGNRDIFIQPELAALIGDIRRFMARQQEALSYIPVPYFFQSAEGKRFAYGSFEIRLKKAAIQAIGRPVHPHMLRHTHATMLVEAGMTYEEVAMRLGHENSKITRKIYVHISEKMRARAEEKIKRISMLPVAKLS